MRRTMSRRLSVLSLTMLSALAVAGCGGTSRDSSTSTALVQKAKQGETVTAPLKAPQRPGIDDTYDEDDRAPRRVEEKDDEEIEIYGRPATPAEHRAAVAFAKSYFAAAAAEDGARACKLLLPRLAKGIGGSYESRGDPSYLRGKTCPEVMTKLFRHRHKLMAAEAAGLEVTDVRVTTSTAFILLAFKGIVERRFMGVERFGKTWKLEALLDSQYP